VLTRECSPCYNITWPLRFSLCYKKHFSCFSRRAVAHTTTVFEADNSIEGVLCKTLVSIPEIVVLLMETGLPSGSPELWRHCLGCFCSWRGEKELLPPLPPLWLSFQSTFAGFHLPAFTSRTTGLSWIKSNLTKKGVNYYRRWEIDLPGTKKQIPDLSGFWMVSDTQSTTAGSQVVFLLYLLETHRIRCC